MRRLLLITYYFPPSGGSGVQRALKFAKYLPEMGWQPTVLTVDAEQAAYPERDPSLLDEIPDGLRIERTPVWDPYNLYARFLGREKQSTVVTGLESGSGWKHRLSRWVRANVFLPDARAGWVPHAIRRANRLVTDASALLTQPFDAILTTGPPHSTHLAGLYLHRRHGIPWLADFRDPWTNIYYNESLPMSMPARWVDASLERKVLGAADAVTAVSPALREALAPHRRGLSQVLHNGFDPEDFEGVDEVYRRREYFRISYVGNMSEAKNPTALWEALRQVREQAPNLRVRLTGSIDPCVLRSARRRHVEDIIDHSEYVPHDEAVRRMITSDMLLLVIPRGASSQAVITGKIFEYIASGRPVLGLGPPDGNAARILQAASAGAMHKHDDQDGLAAAIKRHYDAWANGEPLKGATSEAAAPYSRREQTRELAALLAEMTADHVIRHS